MGSTPDEKINNRPITVWIWTIYACIEALFVALITLMVFRMGSRFGVSSSEFFMGFFSGSSLHPIFLGALINFIIFFIGSYRLFFLKKDAPFYLLFSLIISSLIHTFTAIHPVLTLNSATPVMHEFMLVPYLIYISFLVWFFHLRRINVLKYPRDTSPHTHQQQEQQPPRTLPEERIRAAWQQVSEEMDRGFTDKGLWARCFAESEGDEAKTKARYMQARHHAITLQKNEAAQKNTFNKQQEEKSRQQRESEKVKKIKLLE